MKLLITGGCGFIGSCFIEYILNKYPNYKVINLDKLTYAGKLKNTENFAKNPRYNFVKGDICDKELVNELTKKVDMVVNFAAETHVDRSIEDSTVFAKTNILGTLNLLENSKINNVKRFLQISTDEVYGTLDKEGYFYETTPLAPNSPYSASKASADMLVRSYYKTYKLPVVITRCSNNYGPRQFPEKLIPLFIKRLLNNEKVPVYGDGMNVRDWLYVEDHCRAIDLVLHNGEIGEVYNIGGNNERTNLEITRVILNSLGKNDSFIEYVEDRLGHDRRYAICSNKIQKELGWKPLTEFKTGIINTIDWYVKKGF